MSAKCSGPHQYWEPMLGDAGWQGFSAPHEFGGKDAWSLFLYKIGADWATNFYAWSKIDELLTGGSEECLDWHYLQLAKSYPSWTSTMKATFSPYELEGFEPTTKLIYLSEWEHNPKASWYLDEACGLKWWLCPLWLDLWKGKQPPKECFLYLTAED